MTHRCTALSKIANARAARVAALEAEVEKLKEQNAKLKEQQFKDVKAVSDRVYEVLQGIGYYRQYTDRK